MRNRSPRGREREQTEKHTINEAINAPEVRVIDAEGNQLGVMKTERAMQLAEEQGIDLVEVAPNAEPPVCRLLDYGKLKYRE
ncbi:MAG: translation initiation factor IF-3, partial [Bdellovibrionales bacterium]|nr:translation initiation factor IF-3 [Bdellovibrionales bacterium]